MKAPSEEIYDKSTQGTQCLKVGYIQWVTTLSLTIRIIFIRLAVVAPQTAKFRENSNVQQFKAIQGHRLWCQSKAHMQLSISHKW